jgi:hypothetical protein
VRYLPANLHCTRQPLLLAKESKKGLEILNTLGTDAFPTFTDALQQLNHYKQYYARNGFVHAFSKDVLTNKDEHELIKPL